MLHKKHTNYFVLPLLIIIFAFFQLSESTEEYADQTGKDCAACHVDPSGGAELTAEGEMFKTTLTEESDQPEMLSSSLSLLRLLAGYLHIVTAVFWFGTILYVHLVLKPAYAAQGLPKGEVRVGLISMLIMLVTGIILILFRVYSWDMLVETRFGILLIIKVSLFLIMVLAALTAVFVIGPKLRRQKSTDDIESTENMTAEELTAFDGKKDNPAYIAYKGEIYDVSDAGNWAGGVHLFRHHAGNDLTEFLEQAPHGEEMIFKRRKIGRLVSSQEKSEHSKPQKIFFSLAHFNLTLVLLILLILALWRWWV